MSELSEIKKGLDDLTTIVNTHITKTETYRVERDKILDAHSDVIWDKGDQKGLATKVDRLEIAQKDRTEKEKNRSKILWGTVTGLIGMIADKWLHFLPK